MLRKYNLWGRQEDPTRDLVSKVVAHEYYPLQGAVSMVSHSVTPDGKTLLTFAVEDSSLGSVLKALRAVNDKALTDRSRL